MKTIRFLDENGTFQIDQPENYSGLYFPVAQNLGVKSSITPNLGGDAKIDQNTFLLEPVSIENLSNNRGTRNFWLRVQDKGVWSACGSSAAAEVERFSSEQDESSIKAGFMWHELTRKSKKYQLEAKILTFAPLNMKAEVMVVDIKNTGKEKLVISPIASIPLFARSADNIRDHRHVTSLLHRISARDGGVFVKPTLSFDERGHRKNEVTYYVTGREEDSSIPKEFYLDIDSFMGEGGTLTKPRAVYEDYPGVPSGTAIEGKEALGGLRFNDITLAYNEHKSYIIVMGASEDEEEIKKTIESINTKEKALTLFEEAKDYWTRECNVSYHTKDSSFDGFMKWVSFQPFLRRIYGCSFLPHHDYGRGGRGWRDLWQDCLSLLLMNPSSVHNMIINNYGGVRIDGTNATIIGSKPGEFIADRNGIARVWMDHGVWPFMTTKLYIDQTGDYSILLEEATYFKDEQSKRGTSLDKKWDEAYGVCQRDSKNSIYKGTVLEHILLEHLCSFYEVGSHNHIRLRGADWNDALDMASQNGESVAFTAQIAGNMDDFADMLENISKLGFDSFLMLKEIKTLFGHVEKYDDISSKHDILEEYLKSCSHIVSGEREMIFLSEIILDLREKASWIKRHIQKTEWIQAKGHGWYNSYYDNSKMRCEGEFEQGIRMMLTGQVFTIMSETATKEQVASIVKAADEFLYKKEIGGYRLNTNFCELKLDFGRAYGFAYGEKENGAVFSHMAVMYANALYRRGFIQEGHKALSALSDNAMNFEVSKIYPGIPEYFDATGRGLYHYLTGAASWYMLTMITLVYGVRGELGHLVLDPKLVLDEFDEQKVASVKLTFQSKRFEVIYTNEKLLECDQYKIVSVYLDGKKVQSKISKEEIGKLDDSLHKIEVVLG